MLSHSLFHEPFLHHLLAFFVAKVEDSRDAATVILTDEHAFHHAAHNYKPVVTHFFTCKLKAWIISYLRPVLGLKHISVRTIKFGTTHSAIHAHLLGILESTATEWINKLLANYALAVSNAVSQLDEGIQSLYAPQEGHPNSLNQSGKTAAEAMQVRIDWCNADASRKHLIEAYDAACEAAGQTASAVIGNILEREYGLSAFQPGQAPEEWVCPIGSEYMGYHSSFEGMLGRSDVLETKELWWFKFECEMNLYAHLVNVINHMFLHVCSNYCW